MHSSENNAHVIFLVCTIRIKKVLERNSDAVQVVDIIRYLRFVPKFMNIN